MKYAIITGGNQGIGLVCAKNLAKNGYHVVIACRDANKAAAAVDEVKAFAATTSVEALPLDLNSFKSVHNFAQEYKAKKYPLHVLLNNAGIMALPFVKTEDGFEQQFQVNHLSHFLLTHLLLDVLAASAPARIINVSSRAHFRWTNTIDFDAQVKNITAEMYDRWHAYGRSKLANILFTKALHKYLVANNLSGVTCYSLHPGLVATGLLTNAGFESDAAISVDDGAKTSLYLAQEPNIEQFSGEYFYLCKVCSERSPISHSDEEATKLWNASLQLCNIAKF